MKCKCGTELFDVDIVKTIWNDDGDCNRLSTANNYTYRCPKCFKIKKVKQ